VGNLIEEGRRVLVGEIGHIFNLIFTFPIFNGLMLLYYLFGDFGLAIIVLTLIIKLLLFPLTLQQLKSSKAMQQLQPKLAEIRKKHAKDQQAQLLATQNLYKEYGVNPVAGCLPLLIQLPVLYGLFYAINNLLHLKVNELNSALYPFVTSLSQTPDLRLKWFTFLNPEWAISLGHSDPTYILPILAALATFIQLRMSMPKPANGNAAPANDPTAQSMKMMQYVMPVMIGIFGATAAAGLALYWTISSIFSAVQQYFVTGWGSLLIKPTFAIGQEYNSSSNANRAPADQQRETEQRAAKATEGERKSSDAIESKLRTTMRTNGTLQANRRRHRSSSASARRRGSTQRSRG
jgi:YidC/Oxa1 family membrane protein insertase